MIDGNISMEEDTELRDLVVQTLENNGVLAKVRAELRASVFLALEEQESVMNPEPLLNKTVKQYLANSEGKLLFSLVREFLEYFGLDYTISVYDPETYFGKEYNYIGRNKLCEELGIESNEPLLGEILKNSMHSAFKNTQKNNIDKKFSKTDTTETTETNITNTTFEISIPKVLNNESTSLSNDNDVSDNLESVSQQSPKLPINVTITEKKNKETSVHVSLDELNYEKQDSLKNSTTSEYNEENNGIDSKGNNSTNFDTLPTSPNGTMMNHTTKETEIDTRIQTSLLNKTEPLIKFDESIITEMQTNQNEDINKQNNINSLELQIVNNVQNKKPVNTGNSFGKTVYFEEIIVDGKRENINDIHNNDTFLQDLPPLDKKSHSILSNLPPLNGKKTNINDLKELMDIGLGTDGIDNYEEDFVSSASGSTYDQSPSKDPQKSNSPKLQIKKQDKIHSVHSAHSEDISEEIEDVDDILSSTSCLEDLNIDKNMSNFSTGITTNCAKEL